ncbi:MAG: hypothetical protein AAF682_15025 [Planctomycetota bacterium]
MSSSPPIPFQLAKSQWPAQHKAHAKVEEVLGKNGGATLLRTFEDILVGGRAAINMSLARCVDFLETGRWLNVYEKLASKPGGCVRSEFDRQLREALDEWYGPRLEIERLLQFQSDTHYTALNVGGSGPDYGACCVRLGPVREIDFATVFAGDPLRVVFDRDGQRVLTDEEALERFGTRENLNALAVVYNEGALRGAKILDEGAAREVLENRDTPMQIHVHGVVSRDDVTELLLQRTYFDKLMADVRLYDKAGPTDRRAKTFDKVEAFLRLLGLVDELPGVTFKVIG